MTSTFDPTAHVGRNMELSNGCIVGAMCSVNTAERLPENTVIFGGDCNRRVQQERPPVSVKGCL